MNLREETIKVLRPLAHAMFLFDGTVARITREHLDEARSLLSRLEAGSGEETGDLLGALKNVHRLVSDAAMTGFNVHDGNWAEDLFASQHRTITAIKAADPSYRPRLTANQEGGDAALVSDEEIDNPTDRPHVATPAPGENSERAEAEWLIRKLRDHDLHYSDQERAWSIARDLFAAGRRSMREEAAKVAEETDYHGKVPLGWTLALDTAANRIRAIPEKQS